MKYNRRNNKEEHRQMRAPVYAALETLKRKRVVPFDVPGHKRGRGNPELVELLGEKCVSLDVNSMKPLDNLCHPVSVIKEAEELAAEAFRAEHAFFMVGGTTSSVQGMVLSCCKAGDKIILPRNVHKSVINALVLCGAIPVYVNPERDVRLGISLGMERFEVEKAIKENPDAVTVFIGPCIAKKSEVVDQKIEGNADYVLTYSEIRAIMKAKSVALEPDENSYQESSVYGKRFANAGGVTAAVLQSLKESEDEIDAKVCKCNGAAECKKALLLMKAGRLPEDFIECMVCEGGCVG